MMPIVMEMNVHRDIFQINELVCILQNSKIVYFAKCLVQVPEHLFMSEVQLKCFLQNLVINDQKSATIWSYQT